MRNWLSSPAVAFIGFVSSVIAVAQFIFVTTRWVARQAHADDARGRIYHTVVLFSFAALAVLVPLTWSAVVTQAARHGFPGWQAYTYPVMTYGACLTAVMVVALGNILRWPERPHWSVCTMIPSSLAFAIFEYLLARPAAWERYLVLSIATSVVMVLIGALILHGFTKPRHPVIETV
jgi:hypothetical protein